MTKSATSRTLHRRDAVVAGDRNEQDLPHDRADRPHLRDGVGGQLIAHQRKPLGDLLAVAVDVGAPVELDIDDGEPDAGNRTHAAHAGQAIHLGFDREGDELLDLRGGEAFGLGHDGDRRLVEVGEDVDRAGAWRETRRRDTSTAASARTSRRLRSEWVTRNREHRPGLLTHLIEELGALSDDAPAADRSRLQSARARRRAARRARGAARNRSAVTCS